MAVERIDTENTSDRLQAVLHRARYDFAMEQIPADAKVLELGVGAGGMSTLLCARCAEYTGMDFDPEALELTRQKLGPEAKLIEGDAKAMPFADQSFSHIVCLEVLEHLGDWVRGVDEIQRCLKPAGVVTISVPYSKHGGPSRQNPYHLYEPAEQEIINAFRKRFERVEVFFQFFNESWLETFARVCHVRRLFGLDKLHANLTAGSPSATPRLRIAKQATGMKIGVFLRASRPKAHFGV